MQAGPKAGVLHHQDNRRLYPRRRSTFPATFTVDGTTSFPAFGLDVSGGGLRLLTKNQLPGDVKRSVSLLLMLEGRKVRLDCTRLWGETVPAPDGQRFRYGMKLKAIADGDWEYIMALTTSEAGVEVLEGAVLTGAQRDALLKAETQHRVAELLSQADRLDYNPGHRLPLIEYAFDGYAMRRGTPYYAFTVRSKKSRVHDQQEFHTKTLVGIEHPLVRLLD